MGTITAVSRVREALGDSATTPKRSAPGVRLLVTCGCSIAASHSVAENMLWRCITASGPVLWHGTRCYLAVGAEEPTAVFCRWDDSGTPARCNSTSMLCFSVSSQWSLVCSSESTNHPPAHPVTIPPNHQCAIAPYPNPTQPNPSQPNPPTHVLSQTSPAQPNAGILTTTPTTASTSTTAPNRSGGATTSTTAAAAAAPAAGAVAASGAGPEPSADGAVAAEGGAGANQASGEGVGGDRDGSGAAGTDPVPVSQVGPRLR